MAEITPRRQGELVRGVFLILKDASEGLPAADVLRQLAMAVPPTPFESTHESSPNVRRYEKIVRFSTIGPVKAGWLIKEKGQWSVTDDGRKAYEQFTDPEAFYLKSRLRVPSLMAPLSTLSPSAPQPMLASPAPPGRAPIASPSATPSARGWDRSSRVFEERRHASMALALC